jgi:Flp pilus assembly protein TadD
LSLDEDICPLRALSSTRAIVTEVARERKTGLVDFVEIVQERSPGGIPGSELFLDHVHPTIEGNRLLALAIIKEMVENGIVSPDKKWNDESISEITNRVESSLDEQAHATALKNLSRVLLWAGKEEEAERLVDLAVDAASEDGDTHFTKATLLERAGNNKAALTHYQQAARLSPMNPAIRQAYGVLLSELGHKARARVELETAIRLDRTRPGIYYDLGIVLEDLGMVGQAESAYRSAIKLEPDNADAHNTLGILMARRGDLSTAAREFAEALRINPAHGNAKSNLARATRTRPNTNR